MNQSHEKYSIYASYLLMFIALVSLLPLHLLASFFAGFVIFEIINSLGNITERYIDGQRARLTISVILGLIILSLIGLGITGLFSFVQHDLQGNGINALSQQVDQTLLKLQQEIAQYIPGFIPYTLNELKDQYAFNLEQIIKRANLQIPKSQNIITGGKKGIHSEHLGFILAEMQHLQRSYPGQNW